MRIYFKKNTYTNNDEGTLKLMQEKNLLSMSSPRNLNESTRDIGVKCHFFASKNKDVWCKLFKIDVLQS